MDRTSSAMPFFSFCGTLTRTLRATWSWPPLDLGLGELFHEHFLEAGKAVHDPKGHRASIEAPPLEVPEKLSPAGGRLLVSCLQPQHGAVPIYAYPYGYQDRNLLHRALNPHGEKRTVPKKVFDGLEGKIALALGLHGLGELAAHLAGRDLSAKELR